MKRNVWFIGEFLSFPFKFFNFVAADNYSHGGNFGFNGGYRQGGKSGRGICQSKILKIKNNPSLSEILIHKIKLHFN